jgi:hypothetical protein
MSERFVGMNEQEAHAFAERWLPAWTGNDPEQLLAFYAPDARYQDPALSRPLIGRDALRTYFTKLLARYPDWVWIQTGSDPMPGGFVNHWHAHVPVRGGDAIQLNGVCLVVLDDAGLTARNEVFFDRSPLLG